MTDRIRIEIRPHHIDTLLGVASEKPNRMYRMMMINDYINENNRLFLKRIYETVLGLVYLPQCLEVKIINGSFDYFCNMCINPRKYEFCWMPVEPGQSRDVETMKHYNMHDSQIVCGEIFKEIEHMDRRFLKNRKRNYTEFQWTMGKLGLNLKNLEGMSLFSERAQL